jgi:enoyl-CoA hydratase/carnithine racemase
MSEERNDASGVTEEPVLSRREGSVLVLTLNRPDRLNALSLPMYERLEFELRAADEDNTVRCIVITGSGRGFCSGADLKARSAGPPTGQERADYVRKAQHVNYLLQSCSKPVIAAVNGSAIGGGLELALSADLMVVASHAKLQFPEVSLGTFIGGGAAYTLAERVGVLKARELIYLGEFFLGQAAVEMGIATKSVHAEAVLGLAMELAEQLSEKAPLSLKHAKRLIGPAGTMSRVAVLKLEAEALTEIFGSRDWQEGVDAFHEKRAPKYTGE